MKTNQKYETFCPLFPGFYGTIFQYDNEGEDINYYNEENKTDLNYDAFEWDYREYEERVSKAFVNCLERELKVFIPDLELTYQSVSSPKEYNFANDSINIEASFDLDKLLELLNSDERREKTTQYFKEKYTSCSGFISFHSPHFELWMDKEYIMEKPLHRIGALLDCLASIEIDQDDIMYWAEGENYIDFSPKEKQEND